jgi:hypothetical protein
VPLRESDRVFMPCDVRTRCVVVVAVVVLAMRAASKVSERGVCDLRGRGPSTAVQPESVVAVLVVGSFVRQRGHRKTRPSGSSPRCDIRPQERFGHWTVVAILTLLWRATPRRYVSSGCLPWQKT